MPKLRVPYYQTADGMVTIYQGDNRDIMRELVADGIKADLILTDPPYNVSHLNGEKGVTKDRLPSQPKTLGRRKKVAIQGQLDIAGNEVNADLRKGDTGREIVKAFGQWDYDFDPRDFLPWAYDLLRDGGQLIAFTSEFLMPGWLATPFTHKGLIFWEKTNPTPALPGNYLRPVEIAVWQTKGGKWTFNGDGYTSPVYRVASISGGSVRDLVEPRVHPTQKPQELGRRILANHAKPGDLVADPFGGSGAFARAAYDLGMRVIVMDNGASEETGIPWVEYQARLMRQVRLPL